jgi:drug/metabolite transporter (DMT)-like permease
VVGTYAYVNPVVAVLLGWAILGEPITARTVVAMLMMLGSVALVQFGDRMPVLTRRTETRRTAGT